MIGIMKHLYKRCVEGGYLDLQVNGITVEDIFYILRNHYLSNGKDEFLWKSINELDEIVAEWEHNDVIKICEEWRAWREDAC